MPIASHTKAAEQHAKAASEHKSAAQLHGKGDHAAAIEKSLSAEGCCDTAQKATSDAHSKSTAQAK